MGIHPSLAAHAEAALEPIWLVSTRDQGCAGEIVPQFWRLGPERQWTSSDAREFSAADRAAEPTVFFLHGNRTSRDDAVRENLALYSRGVREVSVLAQSAPAISARGGQFRRHDSPIRLCIEAVTPPAATVNSPKQRTPLTFWAFGSPTPKMGL